MDAAPDGPLAAGGAAKGRRAAVRAVRGALAELRPLTHGEGATELRAAALLQPQWCCVHGPSDSGPSALSRGARGGSRVPAPSGRGWAALLPKPGLYSSAHSLSSTRAHADRRNVCACVVIYLM